MGEIKIENKKAAALVNSNSTRYDRTILRAVNEALSQINGVKYNGNEPSFVTYNQPSIDRELQAVREFDPNLLILVSGDGGLLQYLGELAIESKPSPICLHMPTGRERRLAYELGTPDDPKKVLEETVEDLLLGKEGHEKLSLIEVTLDDKRKIITFDVGFGLATNLLVNYYNTNYEKIEKTDDFRNMAHDMRYSDSFKVFGEALFYSILFEGEHIRRNVDSLFDYVMGKNGFNSHGVKKQLRHFIEKYVVGKEGLREKILSKINRWNSQAIDYFGETEAEIIIDGELKGNQVWTGGFISTNEHVWKNFKPVYRAKEDPKKAHVIVTSLPPAALAFKLKTLYQGGPIGNGDGILGKTIDEVGKEGEVKFPGKKIIQMAGEFYVASSFRYRVLDQQIHFIKPGPDRKNKTSLLNLF